MRCPLVLIALAVAPAALAQPPAPLAPTLQARYDSAAVAWDAGAYPDALARFDRLLAGPDAEAVRVPLALITGERYRTTELAPDGARLRWSPDGRLAAYTAGRTTAVVDVSGARPVPRFQITGSGLAFSPDSRRAAYFALVDTPEIRAARGRADSLQAAGQGLLWQRQMQLVNRLEQEAARLVVREIASGQEQPVPTPGLTARQVAFDAAGRVYVVASPRGDPSQTNVYDVTPGAPVRALTQGAGIKQGLAVAPGYAVLTAGPATVVLIQLATGTLREFEGETPVLSDDGSALAFVARTGGESVLRIVRTGTDAAPTDLKRSPRPLATPAFSPDGRRVAFAQQLRDDWDVYVIGTDGTGEVRLSHEIQHDRFPRWLGNRRVLAMKGEPRHTRAYAYTLPDSANGDVYEERLFHNNTVRTVAPEYEWAVGPEGARVLVVADRDGDTISPERGVYLVDLTREVPVADLRARVQAQQAAEQGLRARGEAMFAGTEAAVRAVTEQVSTARIYGYEQAFYNFDSKFITKPGNRRAIDYIAQQVRAMGYTPELQWFEPRPGVRTANVVATLRGTADPDLVYVVSSPLRLGGRRPRRRRRRDGLGGPARSRPRARRASAARDDPVCLVHGRGGRAARLARVRAPRRGRRDAHRGRAQQRHGGLEQRPPPRQHDPLLQRRHPRPPARRRDALRGDDHLRRALLQEHRRRTPTTRPTATSWAASAPTRSSATRTTTSRTTCWRRSTTRSWRR